MRDETHTHSHLSKSINFIRGCVGDGVSEALSTNYLVHHRLDVVIGK